MDKVALLTKVGLKAPKRFKCERSEQLFLSFHNF